jgi:hypothetical protein
MFTKNLRFFGQVLHPQWPAQTSKMGQKLDFVFWGLIQYPILSLEFGIKPKCLKFFFKGGHHQCLILKIEHTMSDFQSVCTCVVVWWRLTNCMQPGVAT